MRKFVVVFALTLMVGACSGVTPTSPSSSGSSGGGGSTPVQISIVKKHAFMLDPYDPISPKGGVGEAIPEIYSSSPLRIQVQINEPGNWKVRIGVYNSNDLSQPADMQVVDVVNGIATALVQARNSNTVSLQNRSDVSLTGPGIEAYTMK